MPPVPKKKHPIGLNVYFLGFYVRKGLASNDKLHMHAERALKFQEDELAYENQMLQGNMCPACHGDMGGKNDG